MAGYSVKRVLGSGTWGRVELARVRSQHLRPHAVCLKTSTVGAVAASEEQLAEALEQQEREIVNLLQVHCCPRTGIRCEACRQLLGLCCKAKCGWSSTCTAV